MCTDSFFFFFFFSSPQRKEEALVMNAIMDVYMRIFTNILQHNHNQHHEKGNTPALLDKLSNTKRAEVVSALEKLKQEMEKLRHLSHLGRDKDDVFSVLKKIKVMDTCFVVSLPTVSLN